MNSGLGLPALLDIRAEERAVGTLHRYYAPLSDRNTGFTGGAWDTFDTSGSRAADTDRFTAEDLVSVALLGVEVPGRAAIEILGPQADCLSTYLRDLPADRDLAEMPSIDRGALPSAWNLWTALRGLPGLGRTTVSKLMPGSGLD